MVKKVVPQVLTLDDEPLVEETAQPRKNASVFDDDWKLIEELMSDGTLVGSEENIETVGEYAGYFMLQYCNPCYRFHSLAIGSCELIQTLNFFHF